MIGLILLVLKSKNIEEIISWMLEHFLKKLGVDDLKQNSHHYAKAIHQSLIQELHLKEKDIPSVAELEAIICGILNQAKISLTKIVSANISANDSKDAAANTDLVFESKKFNRNIL